MPLTCITGLPGHGKTLVALAKVINEFRGRRIYVYGIPSIDHAAFNSEPLENPDEWFKVPVGSVVIIDEAQKVFPIRGQGKAIPQKCSEFETHRHGGLDVLLITQDGTLLDAHVRKFIDRHIHVYRLFGTEAATIYTYSTFQPKPLAKSSQKGAVQVATWRYPKNVYNMYKSAELHTVKRKIPPKLIIVSVMMAVGIGVIGWAIYYFTSGQFMAEEKPAAPMNVNHVQANTASPSTKSEKKNAVIYTPEEYARLMTPVIAGVPHSAPFYQSTFAAADFPRPYCVIIGDLDTSVDCRCHTQQMTSYETTYELCRFYATEGFYDPTLPRAEQSTAQGELASRGGAAPAPLGNTYDQSTLISKRASRDTRTKNTSIKALPPANRVERVQVENVYQLD